MITKRLLRFLLGPSFATSDNTETDSLALNHKLLNAKHQILNNYGRSSLEAEKATSPHLAHLEPTVTDLDDPNNYVQKWAQAWELSIYPEAIVRGVEMFAMWPLEVSWARYHVTGRSGGRTYWQQLYQILSSGSLFPGFVASLTQSTVEEALSEKLDQATAFTREDGVVVLVKEGINIKGVLTGAYPVHKVVPWLLRHLTTCAVSFPFFYFSSMQILGVYNSPEYSSFGPSMAWLRNFYSHSTPALPNMGVMALWHVTNYFMGLVGRTHLAEISNCHAQMGPEVAHHEPPFAILTENFLRCSFVMRCLTSNLMGFFFFRFAAGLGFGDDLQISFPDICEALALDTVVRCGINHLYILSTWVIEKYVYG